MNQNKENIKVSFDSQKQQACKSLQELMKAFEPELDKLKESLEAIEKYSAAKLPEQSLSFGR